MHDFAVFRHALEEAVQLRDMVMDPNDGQSSEERVIYDDRPHPVFVVTQSWRWIVFGVLIWAILIWLDGQLPGYGLVFLAWGVLGITLPSGRTLART